MLRSRGASSPVDVWKFTSGRPQQPLGLRRAEVEVTQPGDAAHLVVTGEGDLEAAWGRRAGSWRSTSMPVAGRRWATGIR